MQSDVWFVPRYDFECYKKIALLSILQYQNHLARKMNLEQREPYSYSRILVLVLLHMYYFIYEFVGAADVRPPQQVIPDSSKASCPIFFPPQTSCRSLTHFFYSCDLRRFTIFELPTMTTKTEASQLLTNRTMKNKKKRETLLL